MAESLFHELSAELDYGSVNTAAAYHIINACGGIAFDVAAKQAEGFLADEPCRLAQSSDYLPIYSDPFSPFVIRLGSERADKGQIEKILYHKWAEGVASQLNVSRGDLQSFFTSLELVDELPQEKTQAEQAAERPQMKTAETVAAARRRRFPAVLVLSTEEDAGGLEPFAGVLGESLAASGYTLINRTRPGIDGVLLRQFVGGQPDGDKLIQFLRPDDDSVERSGNVAPFEGEEDAITHILSEYADAVIVLGGAGDSYAYWQAIRDGNKTIPVFAMHAGGGDAELIAAEITSQWLRYKPLFNNVLSFADYKALELCADDGVSACCNYLISLMNGVLKHPGRTDGDGVPGRLDHYRFSPDCRQVFSTVCRREQALTAERLFVGLVHCMAFRADELQFDAAGRLAELLRTTFALGGTADLQSMCNEAGIFATTELVDIAKAPMEDALSGVIVSQRLESILLRAELLAIKTGPEEKSAGTLNVFHLMFSLFPYIRDRIGGGSALRTQIDDFLATARDSVGWDWGKSALPGFLGQPEVFSNPGFISDNLSDTDLLDFRPDARGLARMIMDKSLKGSLAIGVFAQWGSGKSNFFRFLRREVDGIAADQTARLQRTNAGGARGPRSHASSVCHITFNAWHYHDANLWASLVTHMFDELSRFYCARSRTDFEKIAQDLAEGREIEDLDRAHIEEIKNYLSLELASSRAHAGDLEKQIKDEIKLQQTKNEQLAELEGDLAKLDQDLDKVVFDHVKGSDAYVRLTALLKEFLPSVDEMSLDELKEQWLALQQDCRSAVGIVNRLVNWYYWLPRSAQVIWGGAFVLVLLSLWQVQGACLDAWEISNKAIADMLSGIKGYVSAGVAALSSFALWSRKLKSRLDDGDLLAAVETEKVKVERSAEYKEKQARRDVHMASLTSLRKDLEESRDQLKMYERARDEVEPGRMLSRYIEDRAAGDRYKSHLSLISYIRKDFERLEKLLKLQDDIDAEPYVRLEQSEKRRKRQTGRQLPQLPKLDRIILYIDDLDRCDEEMVSNVLQAVHLLLGFEIFVVVVGVDSRWLLHSLEKNYNLLKANGAGSELAATPQNYLEKIFQIPLCLKEFEDDTFRPFIEQTVNVIERHRSGQSRSGDPANTDKNGTARTAESTDERRNDFTAIDEDTIPKAVLLEPHERDAIETLGWMQATPRVIKRMVNIYRVIRAGRGSSFYAQNGDYRLTLQLLAIQNGFPQIACHVFASMLRTNWAKHGYDLKAWAVAEAKAVEKIVSDHKSQSNNSKGKQTVAAIPPERKIILDCKDDFRRLYRAVAEHGIELVGYDDPAAKLRKQILTVSRYSFNTDNYSRLMRHP